jgi:hypothetical protein
MTPRDYQDEYGDDPASWPKSISESPSSTGARRNVVWVAEVYEIEEKSELLHFFRGIALDDSEPNEKSSPTQELADPKASWRS